MSLLAPHHRRPGQPVLSGDEDRGEKADGMGDMYCHFPAIGGTMS